jgi:cytoskeleton protein RodZ
LFEIGNTLREARLRRGLEVPECEQETKIRAKYLRAMEEEQFDLMPSPTYVRGFLRTYADFLDLDGQLVLDEYDSRFGGMDTGLDEGWRTRPGRQVRNGRGGRPGEPARPYGQPPGRRPVGGRRRPQPRRTEAQLLWLAIGGVMAVALLVWLGVGEGGGEDTPIPPAPPTAPQASAGTGAAAPAAGRVTITLAGTGEIGSDLVVRGGNAQGPQVHDDLLSPGEEVRYRVDRSIWMRVGNPSELLVTVDGEEFTLEGGTGNFIVARAGPRRLDG